MYGKDHPPPYFHAKHGEYDAFIRIVDGEIEVGDLPKGALRLVQGWLELHREELLANWQESQKPNPKFKKIDPLR
jgi:predicted RNase H-like HicB family nuclease